jgi:hypothetical protein
LSGTSLTDSQLILFTSTSPTSPIPFGSRASCETRTPSLEQTEETQRIFEASAFWGWHWSDVVESGGTHVGRLGRMGGIEKPWARIHAGDGPRSGIGGCNTHPTEKWHHAVANCVLPQILSFRST